MQGQDRARLQNEIMKRRLTGGFAGEVVPPYHVSSIEMMYFMGQFDPHAIRRIVPPELTPLGSDWGTIAVYNVLHGWGVAPYTAFIMGFEVEGFAPVDGQPTQYLHSGLCSGRGGDLLRSHYNTNYAEGWAHQRWTDENVVGEIGQGEGPAVRMSGTANDTDWQNYSGTNHYIGRHRDGGLNLFSVGFTGEFTDVSNAAVEFYPGAETLIKTIEPLKLYWAVKLRNAAFTYGRPRPIGQQAAFAEMDLRGAALMDLFARSGRAAAIVTENGTIQRLNSRAEDLFARHHVLQNHQDVPQLLSWLKPKLAPITASIGPIGTELVSPTIALVLSDGSAPTMAQAIALDEAVLGPGCLVVYFDDPGGDQLSEEVRPALRLLGLSEAEARIAAVVGFGLSSAQAADRLELSVNTVRSALKIIYEKLSISRQAELARIVALLETRAATSV